MQRHCSDQLLIAHADGECSFLTRRAVRKHLEKCWPCRARTSQLEAQAEVVARVLQQDRFVPLDRCIAARRKLEARQAAFESAMELTPRRFPYAAAALIAAAAVVLAVIVQSRRGPAKPGGRGPEPARVLTMARAGDAPLASARVPIHQVVDVDIRVSQSGRATSGRLKIWSDPGQHRAAARWETNGRLKYGIWRPGPGKRPTYHIESELRLRLAALPEDRAASIADLWRGGLDPDLMEAAFLKWLAAREWRPMSLSSDFALFASREGVTLTVEESAAPIRSYLLRAIDSTGDRRVEAVLEFDAGWKPGMSLIRFVSPEGVVEVRMRVLRTEVLPPGSLPVDIFRPVRQPRQANRVNASEVAHPFVPAPPAWTGSELDGAEIAVLYALHRAGACLGEPIELDRDAGGGMRLHGLVRTAERKSALAEAVSSAGAPVPVTVDIRTFEEVAQSATLPVAPYEPLGTVRATRLPIEEDLIRHFASRPARAGDASTADLVTRFTNDAITGSQRAVDQVWALRRLVNTFPPSRMASLDPRRRHLVDTMTRDHLAGLWTSLADTRAILERVLGAIWPQAFEIAPAEQAGSREESFEQLFESVRRIDEILRYLLAGEPAIARPGRAGAVSSIREIGREFQGIHRTFEGFEASRFTNSFDLLPAPLSGEPRD